MARDQRASEGAWRGILNSETGTRGLRDKQLGFRDPRPGGRDQGRGTECPRSGNLAYIPWLPGWDPFCLLNSRTDKGSPGAFAPNSTEIHRPLALVPRPEALGAPFGRRRMLLITVCMAIWAGSLASVLSKRHPMVAVEISTHRCLLSGVKRTFASYPLDVRL